MQDIIMTTKIFITFLYANAIYIGFAKGLGRNDTQQDEDYPFTTAVSLSELNDTETGSGFEEYTTGVITSTSVTEKVDSPGEDSGEIDDTTVIIICSVFAAVILLLLAGLIYFRKTNTSHIVDAGSFFRRNGTNHWEVLSNDEEFTTGETAVSGEKSATENGQRTNQDEILIDLYSSPEEPDFSNSVIGFGFETETNRNPKGHSHANGKQSQRSGHQHEYVNRGFEDV